MSVLMVIVVFFGVINGGHGALVNHCTSLLPAIFIVPHRTSFEEDTKQILNEQLKPVLVVEKVLGLPHGTTSVYVKTVSNTILYEIIAMQRSPPRGTRQVTIKAPDRIVPLFIGNEGPKRNSSFAIKVEYANGQFLVVRCVDTILYRYQIENEFTKATEAQVVRMTAPLGNLHTHTIFFRSPAQQNKGLIAAITLAMDELLM